MTCCFYVYTPLLLCFFYLQICRYHIKCSTNINKCAWATLSSRNHIYLVCGTQVKGVFCTRGFILSICQAPRITNPHQRHSLLWTKGKVWKRSGTPTLCTARGKQGKKDHAVKRCTNIFFFPFAIFFNF